MMPASRLLRAPCVGTSMACSLFGSQATAPVPNFNFPSAACTTVFVWRNAAISTADHATDPINPNSRMLSLPGKFKLTFEQNQCSNIQGATLDFDYRLCQAISISWDRRRGFGAGNSTGCPGYVTPISSAVAATNARVTSSTPPTESLPSRPEASPPKTHGNKKSFDLPSKSTSALHLTLVKSLVVGAAKRNPVQKAKPKRQSTRPKKATTATDGEKLQKRKAKWRGWALVDSDGNEVEDSDVNEVENSDGNEVEDSN
ncbi:hypothetical protein C8R45DRAFT_1082196 [Mycena sanguinolenta]|nr:hypothetical protein C8R45DRAFT_1082196 [Mycena sanguinolenta]